MPSSDSVVSIGHPPNAIHSQDRQLEPFEWYAEMRRTSPVHFDEQRQTWDLFRHENINRVLTDHETFTANRTQTDANSTTTTRNSGSIRQTMITVDPPEHNRLWRFVNERFQPGTLEEYQPRIEELEELLDRFETMSVDLTNQQPLRSLYSLESLTCTLEGES